MSDLCDLDIPKGKCTNFFANSGDPDDSAASDLGLHCLQIKPSGFSRPNCINVILRQWKGAIERLCAMKNPTVTS